MDGGEATDMSEILKALDEIAIVDVQHCAPTKHAAFHVMPPQRRPRSLPRSAGVVPA